MTKSDEVLYKYKKLEFHYLLYAQCSCWFCFLTNQEKSTASRLFGVLILKPSIVQTPFNKVKRILFSRFPHLQDRLYFKSLLYLWGDRTHVTPEILLLLIHNGHGTIGLILKNIKNIRDYSHQKRFVKESSPKSCSKHAISHVGKCNPNPSYYFSISVFPEKLHLKHYYSVIHSPIVPIRSSALRP